MQFVRKTPHRIHIIDTGAFEPQAFAECSTTKNPATGKGLHK